MGSDLFIVLIIILVVVFVWRGPKTLPKIANALGRGVREARREASKHDPAGPEDNEPD
jgi:Sec-independent protein translocase protein TatA